MATPKTPNPWEDVSRQQSEHTDRLAIVGGWLYRTRVQGMGQGVALVFVPDPHAQPKGKGKEGA